MSYSPTSAERYPSPNPEIYSQIDMGELEELRDRGLAVVREHDELPMLVVNYTSRRRVKEEEWSPLLRECRGLIIDPDGLILARPFSRMHDLPDDADLPTGVFSAFEKLDGSMGVQYDTPGGPRIATRGSFVGRQALRGSELLAPYADFEFGDGITPVWEIIYPENKIVVDYGDRNELTLLGLIETASGQELSLPDQSDVPFRVVPKIEDAHSTEDLRNLEAPNAEGFVVLMHETGDRYKVKFPAFQYFLAKRSGSLPLQVWRALKAGASVDEYIDSIPQLARDMTRQVAEELQAAHDRIVNDAAMAAQESGRPPKHLAQIIASIRAGKELPQNYIWNLVQPETDRDKRRQASRPSE